MIIVVLFGLSASASLFILAAWMAYTNRRLDALEARDRSAPIADTETEIPDEPVSDQFPVYEKFPIVNHSGCSK